MINIIYYRKENYYVGRVKYDKYLCDNLYLKPYIYILIPNLMNYKRKCTTLKKNI
jgi:hypothetical protein